MGEARGGKVGRKEGRGGRVEVMMTFRLRSEVFLRPVRGQVSSLDEQQHSRRLSFSLFYSSRLKPGNVRCSSHVRTDATCGYTKYTRLGWTRKKTRPKSPSCGSGNGHFTSSGAGMRLDRACFSICIISRQTEEILYVRLFRITRSR